MQDGESSVCALDLPTLIEVKSGTGRARDKLVVPLSLQNWKQVGRADQEPEPGQD